MSQVIEKVMKYSFLIKRKKHWHLRKTIKYESNQLVKYEPWKKEIAQKSENCAKTLCYCVLIQLTAFYMKGSIGR